MNPEFQAWLSEAGVSELGVKLKSNETKIATLAAKGEAITLEELTEAETLDANNEAIRAEQQRRTSATNKIATLAARNQHRTTTTNDGSLPLADGERLYAQPKSIGHLRSFFGDREVLHANGKREVMSAEKRAFQLGTFILGAIVQEPLTKEKYMNAARDMGLEYLTMNEGAVGAGGYLVPPEFSADFIYLQQYYSVARKYMRNVSISTNDYRQPRMQSGVTVSWEGETATIGNSQMTIDQVQVLLKRLSSLVPFSNELNADSIIGLVDWIVKDSVRQMGQKEDDAAFNGTGTLAYGNTMGIIPGLQKVSNNAGIVKYTTGSAWTGITTADIEALMGALPLFPGMNPALICSNAFYRNVLRKLIVTAPGTQLVQLEQGTEAGKFMSANPQFDGTRVIISQVMPTTDPGAGTISLLYGDLEFSSTFVSKGEYTVFQANQGDTMVATNTSVVRIDERVGIVNHELGSATLAGAVVGLQAN